MKLKHATVTVTLTWALCLAVLPPLAVWLSYLALGQPSEGCTSGLIEGQPSEGRGEGSISGQARWKPTASRHFQKAGINGRGFGSTHELLG